MPWIMLVGLSSGLRLGEVCELTVENVREENRVPFFDVTRAKSEAGVRRVPIHSELVRLGFLEYVARLRGEGHSHLRPGLNPGGPDGVRRHGKRAPALPHRFCYRIGWLPDVLTLREVVERVQYPGLDLSHLELRR